MKHHRFLLCAVLAAAIPFAAQATPTVYAGTLVSNLPISSTAGGFSMFLNEADGVDFWNFQGTAGDTVTLEVDRLNGNFDPVLSLYAGVTSADNSTFDSGASWGGLTYIGGLDDEHPPFTAPGPDGDPFGTFNLTTSGMYTVAVGGGLSTDSGAYPYQITMTDVAAVPEPATYALIVAGLMGLLLRRQRRS